MQESNLLITQQGSTKKSIRPIGYGNSQGVSSGSDNLIDSFIHKKCIELFNFLKDNIQKHEIINMKIKKYAMEKEHPNELIIKIIGMASLICKKLDETSNLLNNHHMLDDYQTINNQQSMTIIELRQKNNFLNKECIRLKEDQERPISEKQKAEKFAEEENRRMIKELSDELNVKTREYETARDDYKRKQQQLKMEKEYGKSTGQNDRELMHTRNVYLNNQNQVTEHYYSAVLLIAKEVKNIRFNSNRIIKNPDIANNIITDVIDSAKKLEVLVPHFEKFMKRFDQGDDIRITLKSYIDRKDKLMANVNKTLFLKEFQSFKDHTAVNEATKTEPNEKNVRKTRLSRQEQSLQKLDIVNNNFTKTMYSRKSSFSSKNGEYGQSSQKNNTYKKPYQSGKKPYNINLKTSNDLDDDSNQSSEQNERSKLKNKFNHPNQAKMNHFQKKRGQDSDQGLKMLEDMGQTLGSQYEMREGTLSSKPSQTFIVR